MATSPIKTDAEDAVAKDIPKLAAVPAKKASPAPAANVTRTGDLSNPRKWKARPPVRPARMRKRHLALIFSFLAMVVLPALLAGYYLWNRAADQYASYAGFSIQREDSAPSSLLLEGLGGIGGGSGASDPEILFDFLHSQALVAGMEDALSLSEIWSIPLENDPYFSYNPSGSIEDLQEHWERMVQVSLDGSTGLIQIRVLAFSPDQATLIAEEILRRSSAMINALSDEARADAIGDAQIDLEEAEGKLSEARIALTKFRSENRIVDPTGDVQTQTGLLANLEAQRAEAIIALDLLRDTASDTDPRVVGAQRRIEVIETRIEAERGVMGSSNDADATSMADVVGEFERLSIDREFAERSYAAARVAFDAARAEARRKSRYLATHITPTTAETPRYPQRITLMTMLIGFTFLAWSVLVLTGYSLRDRR